MATLSNEVFGAIDPQVPTYRFRFLDGQAIVIHPERIDEDGTRAARRGIGPSLLGFEESGAGGDTMRDDPLGVWKAQDGASVLTYPEKTDNRGSSLHPLRADPTQTPRTDRSSRSCAATRFGGARCGAMESP
jgi:hypothetical protein